MIANLIKKSWLPLFFTLIVFSVIAGGISMILSLEEKMTNTINKHTYRIYMNQNDTEAYFTNEDLLSWLNKQADPFTFYKNIPASVSRLSYSNEDSSIYNVGKNAAKINVWNKDDQIAENGKKYFYFDQMEYEVVGYLNSFTNVIASIIPSLQANPKEPMSGEYYIDAGEKSELLIQDLLTAIQKINMESDFDYEEVEKAWITDLFNQSFALLIFLGSSTLLFVSGFTIILSWVEKYKREMFVRRLSGAGETRLLLMIYFNMLSVRFIGIILASLIIFLVTNIFHLLPYDTVFRWESIVVGVVLFFMMDILYTLPMLFINQKKQLIKIMR
ncbi:FtsX-like permease family protein [Paraliobacillus sp. JSM ZJ581]|uniref:FtsX-like permease family protein n=1 Tax=Paraliobacillus sp. JSM ZJ581 TaxID=3342118 RepID=UPI0035A939E5